MRDLLQAEQLLHRVTDVVGCGDEFASWAFSCLFAESLAMPNRLVAGLKVQPDQKEGMIQG
jgi:hypothetical protein